MSINRTVALNIKQQIRLLAGTDTLPISQYGTIVSVDEVNMTCEVDPIDGEVNYLGVLLMAESSTTGLYFKPSVGSLVLISPFTECTYYVSMYSDIDEVWIRGTANGGVVKVSDLVGKLNDLENAMNSIIIWGATVTPPLGGITPFIPTIDADIQSTTVKHG